MLILIKAVYISLYIEEIPVKQFHSECFMFQHDNAGHSHILACGSFPECRAEMIGRSGASPT